LSGSDLHRADEPLEGRPARRPAPSTHCLKRPLPVKNRDYETVK
jgi:hypothetical protein